MRVKSPIVVLLIFCFSNCDNSSNTVFISQELNKNVSGFIETKLREADSSNDFKAPIYSLSLEKENEFFKLTLYQDLMIDTLTATGYYFYDSIPVVFYEFTKDLAVINSQNLVTQWWRLPDDYFNGEIVDPFDPKIRVIYLDSSRKIIEMRDLES